MNILNTEEQRLANYRRLIRNLRKEKENENEKITY